MNKFFLQNRYISIIALIVVLIGCSEDTIEEELFGSLRGNVISEIDGEPLENVRITTNPSTTTVFSDGQGNFAIPNIPVDNYSVEADFDDFETAFEGVEIFDNGADDLETEVQFEWEEVDSQAETLTYDLEIRNSFTNEIRNFSIENETTITVSDLDLGATYFWQVSVTDGENPAVLSLISEFSTLSFPTNAFLFVQMDGPNNVIFSGGGEDDLDGGSVDENVFQLTNSATNSFRPRKNNIAQQIAFLRSVGGETHLFTMDLTGENVNQVTSNIPVSGFRQDELDFAWSPNGDFLLYPSFNQLYRINVDGTGATPVYTTTDGSFISEIDIQEFDEDLVLIKTNDVQGYNARIFTLRLSSSSEETVVLEGENGAVSGIEITANGDRILYSRDISGSQNSNYRLFESRIFIFDVASLDASMLATTTPGGQNDLDPSFSPSEGEVIFSRGVNTLSAIPDIFLFRLDTAAGNTSLDLLFTESNMPDWD